MPFYYLLNRKFAVEIDVALQVKIAVLQEEKRQLASQLRDQSGESCDPSGAANAAFRKRAYSAGTSPGCFQRASDEEGSDDHTDEGVVFLSYAAFSCISLLH